MPAQGLHIQHVHLQNHLRPATQTAATIIGLQNRRISAQTVRKGLGEAPLIVHVGVTAGPQFVGAADLIRQTLTFDGTL